MENRKSKTDLPKSVLFVCNQNAIRSPMAEFLAKDLFRNGAKFQSAGTVSGYVDPFVHGVMEERKIDFSSHVSKSVDGIDLTGVDFIVTLTPQAHHHVMELIREVPVEVDYWPTQNPSQIAGNREQILEMYRKVRNTLENKIKNRFSNG